MTIENIQLFELAAQLFIECLSDPQIRALPRMMLVNLRRVVSLIAFSYSGANLASLHV